MEANCISILIFTNKHRPRVNVIAAVSSNLDAYTECYTENVARSLLEYHLEAIQIN